MRITFTERKMQNGVLIITSWDGKMWCNVRGLKPEDQTPENIAKEKKRMAYLAQLPNAPRDGVRKTTKCSDSSTG